MPFMGLFALPAERGPMSDTRPCKNFQEGNYSESCKRWIESDRPKWAKYCKACGINRSREWKRENPERVKLYGNDEAAKAWRKNHNWNQYVQDWRELHRERSREQTRRAVRTYRERKRRREEGTIANASSDGGEETSPHQSFENGSLPSQYLARTAVKETKTTEPVMEMAFRLKASADAARHRRWMEVALTSGLMVVVLTTTATCLYVSVSSLFNPDEKKYANSIIQYIVVGLVGFFTGKATTKNNSPPSE
jgi:hypothetical protein